MSKSIRPAAATTEVWVRLNLAHRNLSRRFETALRQEGLPSAAWYDVLWGLERAPEGLRPFELQRQCLYDQPNLSRTLKRMKVQGLVDVETVSGDRRGRIMRLTDKGRALRERMWQVYGSLMIEAIERPLTEAAAKGLIEGLNALDELPQELSDLLQAER